MSCGGCVFRTEGFDHNQVGCKLDILDTITQESSIYKMVDGSYQFDRICPYRSTENKSVEEAHEAASFPFHFLIIDTNVEDTKKTFNSIEHLANNDQSKVCIITTDSLTELQPIANQHPNVFISLSFEENEDTFSLMDKAFDSVQNGYSIVLTSGQLIDQTDLNKVTKFVNEKMKRLALIQDSPFVINNILFKYLKGNKGSSFKDKVEFLTTEQKGVNMIFTWEDVDEVINS
jgi:hypothetical protein